VHRQRATGTVETPADVPAALDALSEAGQSDYFRNDAVLGRIRDHLNEGAQSAERRIEILRLLESRSLLSQYMTRSRKREVLEKRVERAPQVLSVSFSPAESAIYDHVTQGIRAQAIGKSGVSLFSLVARQRQMASSIVGALESWKEKNLIEELLWEDFGLTSGLVVNPGDNSSEGDSDDNSFEDGESPTAFGFQFDIAELEGGDQKYRALHRFLTQELQKNPREKFVVFAFYRGTLKYLARRLKADGVNTTLIMGDMGNQKDELLLRFAHPDGPSVLLSSEVGSEGIDLQFCRFIVNYDLPWNPMKVEQRIGRLDRLGQKAERISIINLTVDSTIEDRILMRLYNRINVFRESIGDLEEILGEITEKILVDLLNPNLTDEERERRSAAAELAVCNTQQEQQKLEEEAVNLVGFSDYILDHINESRQRGRWLSGAELRLLVEDFLAQKYPGTKIEDNPQIDNSARILLSEEAQRDLGYFRADTNPATRTRLHHSGRPILCIFDPRRTQEVASDVEFIEPSHPLIQWIRATYEHDQTKLHRVPAIKLDAADAGVPAGDYVFSAHRCSLKGLKSDQFLAFRAIRLGDREPLNGADSEAFLTCAARQGKAFPNALNILPAMDSICAAAVTCEECLADSFGDRLSDFEAENKVRCDQQETSARKLAERRLEELNHRISRYRSEGNLRPVAMTEGLIRKEQEQLKQKIQRVEKRRDIDPTMVHLALGVIRVA
jgi:Helicase conserved C-terminal domain